MRTLAVVGSFAIAIAATVVHAQPAKPSTGSGVCVKAKDDPVLVEIDRGKLKYCFDHGKQLTCYSTDLEDGSLWATAAPAHNGEGYPSTPKPPDEPSVETTEGEVKLCLPNSTECKTFKPKNAVDPGLGLTASTNRPGTLVALTNSAWVETFDVKSGKRLARFKASKAKHACSYVDFAGDAIVVDHYDCGDVTVAESWLGTKTGKRLSVLGGKSPIGMATNPVQIKDTHWAFASRSGDAIAIHDVKTGKLVKRITLGPRNVDDPLADSELSPVLAFGTSTDDNEKLALVYGDKRVGDVVVVDLATSKVSSYPAKRCTK